MKDSTRFIDKYLGEIIDYGGEPYTRGEVIFEMQSRGIEQGCIDRWFQGYELAQRLRERREAVCLRMYLQPLDACAPEETIAEGKGIQPAK